MTILVDLYSFHLRVGREIYIYLNNVFISTSFVDKIFISAMPCSYLFISPIFPTKSFIS